MNSYNKIKNLVYFSDRKNNVDQSHIVDELLALKANPEIADRFMALKESGLLYGNETQSSVAYVMGLTDVSPSGYPIGLDVLHGSMSLPDCDLDFPQADRERVIEYTRQKYGEEYVSHIATFSRIKARTAIRDAARALGYDYDVGDRVAKSMPPLVSGVDTPLWACLERSDKYADGFDAAELFRQMYQVDPVVREIVEAALFLEGQVRQSSLHAAGVLIGDRPLSEVVPEERRADGPTFTQWDKRAVEDLGLLKMDFLGLLNLDIIQATCRAVGISVEDIPIDDKATFDLLASGDVIGCFQVEGSALRKLLRSMQPADIGDISAALALYRPGPIGSNMHVDYVERKRGRQAAVSFHPDADDILGPTQMLLIYQEQLLQIAMRFAGYSLADADALRSVVGKKKVDKMAGERAKFVAGCVGNGYAEVLANEIFDIIEKFGLYGFNLGHSMSYSFITIWTAYLKTHYPRQYMAALCSAHSNDLERCAFYLSEARRMGIKVLTPDVNRSGSVFEAGDDGILVSLAAVKGVGVGIAGEIIGERERGGRFVSLIDFVSRVNPSVTVLTGLAKVGALDEFGTRLGITSVADTILSQYRKYKKKNESNNLSLFDSNEYWSVEISDYEYPDDMLLELEREFLGIYVSGHPLDAYPQPETSVLDAKTGEEGAVEVLALISDIKYKRTKKGENMAIVVIQDASASVEVLVFPKTYEKAKGRFHVGDIGTMFLNVGESSAGERNYVYRGFEKLGDNRVDTGRQIGEYLNLYLPRGFNSNDTMVAKLKGVLLSHSGRVPVSLFVGKQTKVKLSHEFAVAKSPELLSDINNLFVEFSGVKRR